MMFLPKLVNIPSESTIECLSNHYILQLLGQPGAWMLTPTRREEKGFGYDAWLCNTKVVIVQYKRIHRVNSNGDVSIKINPSQHFKLQKNFPDLHQPYVFYAFSDYHDYQQINDDYLTLGSPHFFNHTLFFDVHSLGRSDLSVRLFRKGVLSAKQVGNHYSGSINHWRGPVFVNQIAECNLGQIGSIVSEVTDELVEDVENGKVRLNFLFWKLPQQNIV